ncbi:hypothetical protein ACXR2U_07815 [Jatrophihabitans sp. YIM 134969]
MSAPLRPRSPRWSVLLRFGVGFTVAGLFIALFSYQDPTFGFVVLAVGVACLLASVVTYFRESAAERERLRGGRPPSRRSE